MTGKGVATRSGARMNTFLSRDKTDVGVAFDIPGMGCKNPRTGAIEGFEAGVARAIVAKILGAAPHVDFVQVTNEQRIPALQNGSVDMVLSQITITPDRATQVDFSIPYYVTREAILVLEGSCIERFEGLEHKRIAVTAGSISIRRMEASLPDAKLLVEPLNAGCLDAVAKGEADAASNDLINLELMQKRSGRSDRYRIIDLGDRFDPKPYGVAVKKGNTSLVALLNAAIESLKTSREIDRLQNESLSDVGVRAET